MRNKPRTGIAATAALALAAISVSGCSSARSGASAGPGTSKNLELIVGTQSDPFYVSMECGAKQEAHRLGVNLTVTGPATFSVPDQKPLIEAALVSDPNVLLVAPADPLALDPSLQVLQNNDTKIVFVDGSSSDMSLGISRISSDDTAGGRLAADDMGQMLGGKGTVAVISDAGGGPAASARVLGFQQELAARYPGITLLAEQNDAAGSLAGATKLADSDIKAHPDLAGVLATDAVTTQGAAAAVQQARMTDQVKVATFGAGPAQMTGLGNRTISLVVAQEPAVEGADAVQQAVHALRGESVRGHVATPMTAITPQNMSKPSIKPYIYNSSCPSSLRGANAADDT